MTSIMLRNNYQYRPPVLTTIFHRFPHVNVSLQLVNSTFDPRSEVYIESLGILGSIPALWLIFTLFILLIYLLTRCCDRKPRAKHSITVLKWSLFLFAVLCGATLGIALYGNDDVHNGLDSAISSLRAIDENIVSARNQTLTIETTLQIKVKQLMTELNDVFSEPVRNQTIRKSLLTSLANMQGNTTSAVKACQEIQTPLHMLNFTNLFNYLYLGESIRYPATMALYITLLVFCIMLIFGVYRHSRCCLITCQSIGFSVNKSIFSIHGNVFLQIIICWLLSSLYLVIAVATGDVCMSPDRFLERQSPPPVRLQMDILAYYLTCETSRTNPFHVVVKRLDILTTEVKLASNLMSGLPAILNCQPINREYIHALQSTCDTALFGLALMLLAMAVAGFFFTVLVWLDSHTWIYIRKKREYLQVDEQDPYMPPSAASQAIAARTMRPPQGDIYGRSPGVGGGVGPGNMGTLRASSRGAPLPSAPQHPQYATLNRKFRTLEHPGVGNRRNDNGSTGMMMGNNYSSHTLGHKKFQRDGPGQYSTLSKKCKTLESSDFY
ncbi:protein tweety [Diaphorina citri]|uniref:Protein tweety homolog n=1 Tax=Diaphorina citri TaxID=121845 RepID=A0A3Q0JC59_DIACI|nr:protein tweety [Diaphorina citri]